VPFQRRCRLVVYASSYEISPLYRVYHLQIPSTRPTHVLQPSNTSSHGVSSPSALTVSGIHLASPSLPHPVRADFRFSQPLTGLSLQIPLGLFSCRNTLGVHPSEHLLHRGLAPFSRPMPLLMLNHQPLFHHGVAAFMRTQIPSANGEVFDGSHLQRFTPSVRALT
jgi:hypothetical protein